MRSWSPDQAVRLRRARAHVVAALVVAVAAPGVARAEIYSWVDDAGNLHFSNVDKKRLVAAGGSAGREYRVERGADVDGFGGEAPLVVTLPDGGERTLYPVDVARYDAIIARAAEHYNLPFAFVKAIAKVESNFNPRALSRASAKGIMQLIDSTARLVSVEDPFDAEQSIFGGARYLRMLANEVGGDLSLTAAAYNAGPEAVRRAGGVPPYAETQAYVVRVTAMYRYYRGKGGDGAR